MEDKVKNMEYWKKKNNIPGIEALADSGLTDGKAGSSAFQMATPGSSPNKGFLGNLGQGLIGKGKMGFLNPAMWAARGVKNTLDADPTTTNVFGGGAGDQMFSGGVLGGIGGMMAGTQGQPAIPQENPMAAVPVQTPMVMKSPMKQEDGGVKTIAGQDIIKGEGKDEGNFYYKTIDGEQIFIEDPDGVVAKNVTDGMVSDLDFSFEETEDGYYKVTGVAGEGGEQPVRPEDVVPSMMPYGVGETPMEMYSPTKIYSKEDPEKY
jgi:hypothetical protein